MRVGGIRKGSVRSIHLPQQPNGKVVVLMDLSKETQGIVKMDSVAAIKSEGMLGYKYVEISFGSRGSGQAKGRGDHRFGAASRYRGFIRENPSLPLDTVRQGAIPVFKARHPTSTTFL